jgi:hypothetical protein
VEYDFTIDSEEHELIGVFSEAQGEWNLGTASDGLSWYTASHRTDFLMRTGTFESFPHCTRD